jgi:hypothetical protein
MLKASLIAHPPSLSSIEVLGDRGLRIVVEEFPNSDALSGHSYELVWEVVVGFLVRGDPFPTGRSNATLSDLGRSTQFLKMIRSGCHTEPDYIAAMHGAPPIATEIRHWKVSTTDAAIDVAATYGPTVRRLPREIS